MTDPSTAPSLIERLRASGSELDNEAAAELERLSALLAQGVPIQNVHAATGATEPGDVPPWATKRSRP